MNNLFKLILISFLVVLPRITFACWGATLNGPSVVCPNTGTNLVYSLENTSVGCTSFTSSVWGIVDANGDSQFIVNGQPAGRQLNCCYTVGVCPCLPQGPVAVRWGSAGPAELRVDAACGTPGTVSKAYPVKVGLPPPSSISGASEVCVGATSLYVAAEEPDAYSYTWVVPNTTWKVNGTNGSKTIVGQGGRNANITVGSNPGSGNVGIRANLEGCAGNSFIYKNTIVYTSAPGVVSLSGPYGNVCSDQTIAYSASTIPNASSYYFQIKNSGGGVVYGTPLYGSPYYSFQPSSLLTNGAYTIEMYAVNGCGLGPAASNLIYVESCSGGCGSLCLLISPNPSDSEMEVIMEPNPSKAIELDGKKRMTLEEFEQEIVETTLFSQNTLAVSYTSRGKSKKLKIDTKEIPDGRYVLEVKGRGFQVAKHVIIKHN